MGRYYTGDIEGKFWFGVQPSDDPSFFGGTQVEPGLIRYLFEKADMEDIDSGLAECAAKLGGYREKLDDYFGRNGGYEDRELAAFLGVTVPEMDRLLGWYARLELGEKIRKCVEESGRCEFDAEL